MFYHLRNLFNGVVFGCMLLVPGISATVFAVLLGFYDDVLWSINHFREDVRRYGKYLGIFLLGVIVGSVAFSSLILYLLYHYSFPTMMFFIGSLIGTVPLIYSKTWGLKNVARRLGLGDGNLEIDLIMVAFVALILLSRGALFAEVDPADVLNNMTIFMVVYVFIAGVINGATLVIPGLSGALILLLMGIYPLIIYSVSGVGGMFIGRLEIATTVGVVLIPFGIGALIGNLSMARVMEKLMQKYSKSVYAVILGFLLASVVSLLFNPIVYQSGVATVSLVFGLFMFVVGFVIAFMIGKRSYAIDN